MEIEGVVEILILIVLNWFRLDWNTHGNVCTDCLNDASMLTVHIEMNL